MMRVSTASLQTNLVRQMQETQVKLNETSVQSATGNKSESYAGVSHSTTAIAGLEADLNRSADTVDRGELHSSRIETMYASIDDMVDLVINFQADLSAAMAGGDDITSFALDTSAEAALDSFVASANLQFGDQYVFGGTVTDSPPVDLTAYPPQTTPSAPDTSYYQGAGETPDYRVSSEHSISYSETADQDAFEKTIRAFSLVANASQNPTDHAALEEAYELLGEAASELATAQTRLSLSADQVDRTIDQELDYQLSVEATLVDLKDVDVAQALVELESLQIQLDASYSVSSKLSELSLFNYMN